VIIMECKVDRDLNNTNEFLCQIIDQCSAYLRNNHDTEACSLIFGMGTKYVKAFEDDIYPDLRQRFMQLDDVYCGRANSIFDDPRALLKEKK